MTAQPAMENGPNNSARPKARSSNSRGKAKPRAAARRIIAYHGPTPYSDEEITTVIRAHMKKRKAEARAGKSSTISAGR